MMRFSGLNNCAILDVFVKSFFDFFNRISIGQCFEHSIEISVGLKTMGFGCLEIDGVSDVD
jgi:hypothetical protein